MVLRFIQMLSDIFIMLLTEELSFCRNIFSHVHPILNVSWKLNNIHGIVLITLCPIQRILMSDCTCLYSSFAYVNSDMTLHNCNHRLYLLQKCTWSGNNLGQSKVTNIQNVSTIHTWPSWFWEILKMLSRWIFKSKLVPQFRAVGLNNIMINCWRVIM